MTSPPPSPLRITMTLTVAKAITKLTQSPLISHQDSLDFASGVPITHPSLCGEGKTCARRVAIGHGDRYLCTGAVDVVKLLRGSRTRLLEKAMLAGANVLVDESWTCRIRIPKNRQDGKFRVQIRYYASASRSSIPDPQKPVAVDKVTNVPGLMTIVERQEIVPP